MKLDIIIPTYKAKEKIIQTIFSFGELKNYHFIIVNDADNIDYTSLKETFPNGDFTFITNPINGGPGVCRNLGLSAVKYKYCMFIDAGDLIFSIYNLNYAISSLKTGTEILAGGHFIQNEDDTLDFVNNSNNRLHGKIYSTSFLNKYNIRFNEECSFTNEDIGFNFQCRLESQYWLNNDDGLIIQTLDHNSLTRKNNCEFYYNQNLMGLAKNAVFAFQKAFENKVPLDKIIKFSYSSIVWSYIFYYQTLHAFPEYEKNAIDGAKYYYHNYIKNIEKSLYSQDFIEEYHNTMREIYNNYDDQFLYKIPSLSIYDWLRSLE